MEKGLNKNKTLLPILILFLSGCASTTVSGTFGSGKPDISATVNIPVTLNQKKKFATELGVVYVGMPKEDLEKAGFTKYLQKSYYQKDNEEWITFYNWMTEIPDDTIYLKDGIVKGWEKRGGFLERSLLIEKTKYEIRDRFGKEFLYQNGKPRSLKEIAKDPHYLSLSSFEKDCFKLWYWDEIITNMPEFKSFSNKERLATFYGFIKKELLTPEVKETMIELIERGKESVLEGDKEDNFKFSQEADSL